MRKLEVKTIITLFLLLVIFPPLLSQTYNSPVSSLIDQDKQRKFLESILEKSRQVQTFEDTVMITTGFHSTEHLAAIDSLHKTDSLLVKQVDRFLSAYGFPQRKVFGEKTSIVTLQVMARSSDPGLRAKHFSKFYKAYKVGELERRRLIEYLEGMYILVYHRNFYSYNIEEKRLDELMNILELKG